MRARARASWGLTERTEKWCWHLTGRRQTGVRAGSFAEPRLGPAAAARSERSLAGRVAASTVASQPARRRQLVVRALPRPSVNVGASIERVFGRSTVRTKPGLKGRYSLPETCLVTSSRHRSRVPSSPGAVSFGPNCPVSSAFGRSPRPAHPPPNTANDLQATGTLSCKTNLMAGRFCDLCAWHLLDIKAI